MHSTASPPQTPTPLLWERLRALFERIIAVIGAPAIIAALTLAPRMRTSIVRQLALVEILARKLLLAEAATLAPPPQRGPRTIETQLSASGLYTAPPTRRTRTPSNARAIDLTNPESWSARFALAIPRDQRTVSDRHAPRIRALWRDAPRPSPAPDRAAPQRNSDAFLIARRAEALRRVLHNLAPYVTRLSRARRIGVARSRRVITRYALKAPRRFIGDRHDPLLTVHIFSAAVRARTLLLDTS